MVEFQSIVLRNTGPFKNVKFQIKPGLTVVYGLNRSGGKFSSNANGAGKSYLMSQLSEILYEDPIVGEKSDRVRHGERSMTAKIKGKKVTIIRSGSKVKVKIDGELKKFRTIPIAREYVRKLIPISPEEFSTYVYLDSRVPHPLVMGSSNDRKRFFNSFFGLDKIDAERKLFQARLSELNKIRLAYNDLKIEYKRATADLITFEENEELKARVAKDERILAKLQRRSNEIQDIKRLLVFITSSKDQIKKLEIACGGDITQESFDQGEADTRWHLKKDKADLEDALAWEQYQRDTRAYEKAFNELSAKARKLVNKRATAKEGSDRYVKAKSKLTSLKEELDDLKVPEKPKKVEKPEGAKIDLQVLRKSYSDQLRHASQFKNGKCETCGQDVKVNPKKIQAKLDEVETRLEAFDEYDQYESDLEDYKKKSARKIEIETSIQELKSKVTKYKEYHEAHKQLQGLPEEPEPFQGKKLESLIKAQMVEEDKARLALYDFCRPHLTTILEAKNLTKDQIAQVKDSDGLQAKINRVQERLAKIKAKIEVQATLRVSAKRLKSKITAYKEELKDEQALKLLIDAYSDKAMKKIAVKAISNRLMDVVNKYARSVFPEDYQFEFRWDKSQLSLIVHRKYGKKNLPSDVRKLSGAESKLFTLILIPALLSFVPKHKRSNLLVLDEPSANMSEETTVAFQNLLPVLNKFIPSIVVVTPKSKEIYEGASNFTVCKQNGVSTLLEGHPQTFISKRELK